MPRNKRVILRIYQYTQRSKVFGPVVKFLYKSSFAVFFLIYYAGAKYLIFTDRTALIYYLSTPAAAIGICYVLRRIIRRRRPFEVIEGIEAPADKKKRAGYSFPSNHSASAFAIAFAILSINSALGIAVSLLAVLTGISRIALGVHYPGDVAAGFVLSTALALLGFSVLPMYL